MYNFYENNLISGFIKYLISKTNLPIYNYVEDGDFLIKGCNYLYRGNVIRCLKTGMLNQDKYHDIRDDIEEAEIEFIEHYQLFESKQSGNIFNFTSNRSYYDFETHRYLGEYLRAYKGVTDINLMPFYNCFSLNSTNKFFVELSREISYRIIQDTYVRDIYKRYLIEEEGYHVLNEDECDVSDGIISIKQGITISQKIIIPNQIGGKSVTQIAQSFLSGKTGVLSLFIDHGVTTIGGSAFQSCTGLTTVTIPDSVTYIGTASFSNCTSLTNITIPNNVTTIGGSAFSQCTSLTNITIPNSVTTINVSTFYLCQDLTDITIGNSVRSIGDRAFYGCVNLTNVYYTGTDAQWTQIFKGSNNDPLTSKDPQCNQTIYSLNSAGYYSYGISKEQITPVIILPSPNQEYSQSTNWDGYTGEVVYGEKYYKQLRNLKENTQELDCYVYLVPVKFDKEYTIAMDSIQTIYVTPVICNSLGRIKRTIYSYDTTITEDRHYIDEPLSKNITVYNGLSVRNPVLWEVSLLDYYVSNLETMSKEELDYECELLYHQEDNLYMLIQVPKTNTSSIVVLEGDYRTNINSCYKYVTSQDKSVYQEKNDLYSPLSLLQISTKNDILPFSDRLIEYLLQNVVDSEDMISQDIYRVQKYIRYHTTSKTEGVWDNLLQCKLFEEYMNDKSDPYMYKWDITGFVDKDVEKKITRGLNV